MNEAALRDRVEYLEAENANLKRQLRHVAHDDFVGALRGKLGCTPSQARFLWVLWDCRMKTKEAIFQALYSDRLDQPDFQIVNVYAAHVRAAIRPVGADLTTHWAVGYQLLPADRAKIAAHIGIEVQP